MQCSQTQFLQVIIRLLQSINLCNDLHYVCAQSTLIVSSDKVKQNKNKNAGGEGSCNFTTSIILLNCGTKYIWKPYFSVFNPIIWIWIWINPHVNIHWERSAFFCLYVFASLSIHSFIFDSKNSLKLFFGFGVYHIIQHLVNCLSRTLVLDSN